MTLNIHLNGRAHELAGPLTLIGLLESIDLAGKPVVVELDEQAVFPRNYATTQLLDGAKVEIVALAAGG
jgi:sulfur carrier protein